jgi:TorA maturation chaperone TorD
MVSQQADAKEPLVQDILNRARRFGLLADALTYPDGEQWQAVSADLALMLETHAPMLSEGERAAAEGLARAWEESDEEAVRAEYGRMFLGQTPCSLHEASYSSARNLAGPAAAIADISGFYLAFGVDIREDSPERPDHLPTELEFYATLLVKEAYALFNGWHEEHEITVEAARHFLGDHLGRWRGVLSTRLGDLDACSPYPEIAGWLDVILELECDLRQLVPEPLGDMVSDPMQSDALICPHAGSPGVSQAHQPLHFMRRDP